MSKQLATVNTLMAEDVAESPGSKEPGKTFSGQHFSQRQFPTPATRDEL
jgi:hypothetical protein